MNRFPAAGLIAVVTAGLFAVDRPLYEALQIEGVRARDWHQILRQLGDLRVWLIVALLIYLMDRARLREPSPGMAVERSWPPRPAHHRAGLLLLAATLSGLAAEIGKLVFRRLRPGQTEMLYAFRPLTEGTFSSSGLSMPSGHAAVAFGACVMLGLLYRPIRIPMLLLAIGCGLSRVQAGAHYPTDVWASALIASAVAAALYRAGEGPRRFPAGGLAAPAR